MLFDDAGKNALKIPCLINEKKGINEKVLPPAE